MGIIVAIGGGENGRPGKPYETGTIDKEIVRLSGKSKPNFLFIGLAASRFADSYYNVMCNIYGGMYGCSTDHLTLDDIQNAHVAKAKISNADIIYVGGGNTLRLMTLLRKYRIDEMLKDAYANTDKVLCGLSAGAICWCEYGQSDSRKLASGKDIFIKVTGLGFVPVLMCPHYNTEESRQADLPRMMKTTYKMPAIAVDDGAFV